MSITGKVTRKINLDKSLIKIRKEFQKETKSFIGDLIVGTIESGESPVSKESGKINGKGKWRGRLSYNKQYAKQHKGGKRTPVNMTRSGKMLSNLKIRLTKTGLSVFFSSPIAKYHDQLGAGASKKIRRLLPANGEVFVDKIMDAIIGALQSAVKRNTRR